MDGLLDAVGLFVGVSDGLFVTDSFTVGTDVGSFVENGILCFVGSVVGSLFIVGSGDGLLDGTSVMSSSVSRGHDLQHEECISGFLQYFETRLASTVAFLC